LNLYSFLIDLFNEVVLCNLEPRKFVGVVSNGMVIAASNEDKSKIELLEPPGKFCSFNTQRNFSIEKNKIIC
jgi:tRNA-binding EMAP/Myf-like protein